MTILYPARFKEAPPASFDGVFEWDFLKPAFKTDRQKQIEPMDLDAIVERKRRFLVFETKNQSVPIPTGQLITLEQLVRTGFFTVIILRCKSAASINGWDVWWLMRKSKKVGKEHHIGDADLLVKYCRRWFLWASVQ